jgi:hypothetical protein
MIINATAFPCTITFSVGDSSTAGTTEKIVIRSNRCIKRLLKFTALHLLLYNRKIYINVVQNSHTYRYCLLSLFEIDSDGGRV